MELVGALGHYASKLNHDLPKDALFGGIAIVIALFFGFRAPLVGPAASPTRRKVAQYLIVIGVIIYVVGALAVVHKASWLGLLLLTTGVFQLVFGIVPWTRIAAICSLIWIAWPWPGALYERIDGWIHRRGLETAVATFDLVGVPVFAHGNWLEFRARTIDSSIWINGPDGFVSLLLVAAFSLVVLRRTLAVSLATVAFVPLLVWVAEAGKALICYWAFTNFNLDLTTDWPLTGMRVGFFVLLIGMIWLTNFGVNWALLPVLSDPNARTNLTMHSLYNVVTLWPLKVSLTAQQADNEYLDSEYEDEDLQTSKRRARQLVSRRMPDLEATKNAPAPFENLRLRRTIYGLAVLGILLSAVIWVTPTPKSISLPRFDAEKLQMLANESIIADLEFPGQFANAAVDEGEGRFLITWNFASNSGPVTLMSRFPVATTRSVWFVPEGLQPVGASRPFDLRGVHMSEVEFAGQMGSRSIGWFAAMQPDGTTVPARV